MTANIQEEVNQIVEFKSRATRLDNLIQGYRTSRMCSPPPTWVKVLLRHSNESERLKNKS